MEMQIKTLPQIKIVGLSVKTANPEEFGKLCPQLWDTLCPRAKEIKVADTYSLAACFHNETDAGDEFEYMAGYPVESFDQQPKDMLKRTIPAYEYAVFTHTGDVARISETYQYIYSEGLKKHKLTPVDSFDMEYYGDDFNSSDCTAADSKVHIYVAIKRI